MSKVKLFFAKPMFKKLFENESPENQIGLKYLAGKQSKVLICEFL